MKKRTITDDDIEIMIGRFREVFVDKHELEEIFEDKVRTIVREEIKHLPTKDEFYEQTEKLYKRQSDLEDENDLLSHRVSKHTDQIEKLANHIGLSVAD